MMDVSTNDAIVDSTAYRQTVHCRS